MATELNFTIDQGGTWTKSISWQDAEDGAFDLSLCTAKMQIRRDYADNDKTTPFVSLTDEDGITLGSDEYNIVITIPAEDTATIPIGTHYYDLTIIDDIRIIKVIRGKVFVMGEVSR